MADPNLIGTSVKVGGDFKSASGNTPVLSFQVKPEIIPKIISSLGDLKDRTDDSDIVRSGNKYSFIDKRTNQPLAELDTVAGTLAMYKSPKDMAARIDSAFISVGTINKFIADSKVEANISAAPTATPNGLQVATR